MEDLLAHDFGALALSCEYRRSLMPLQGAMTEEELQSLFTGYGYEVRFCGEHEDLDADLTASLEWALSQIKKIQNAARLGIPITRPTWPMIVLSTPKGMGAPDMVRLLVWTLCYTRVQNLIPSYR